MSGARTLFIIYDLERGGPEMRLLDLAEKIGPELGMVVCVTSGRVSLIEGFRRCGIEPYVIPIEKAYREWGKLRRIAALVRREKIDVVNTYDLKGLVIALFVKLFSGRRVSVVHHIVDLLHNYRPRQKAALALLLKVADRVLSNSTEAKELLADGYFPGHRIEVIHNGVDDLRFKRELYQGSRLREELGIGGDEPVLGTVANLREEKEYPFLLRGFARLSERFPRLRLLCVGGGPLLEEMRELSRTLGIEERTIFAGYVENVPEYLALMDVCVLCSRKEGFPNVLIQAMSMEVPVVSTAVGGCREIIEHGADGFLFPVGDHDAFVEKVGTLLADEKLHRAFAAAGKLKVAQRFTLRRMMERYLAFFRDAAPARPLKAATSGAGGRNHE